MPGDINAIISTAIGGQSAGDVYEEGSDRHFPILVRLAPQYRNSLENIRQIKIGIPSPDGLTTIQVPLVDVANISLVSGASFIYREQQQRYIPIKFSVRGRDLGTTILDAKSLVSAKIKIPGGYRMEWVGEFSNLQDAIHRLALSVPLALLFIFVLLYINFGVVSDVLLALSVIPMVLIGGIVALYFTGTPFSVSAAIGFIALFGIATMNGILMLTYFNQHLSDGISRTDAIYKTCQSQMRPVMLTCIVACVGLVPAAISTGIGSQVQKPLALVVVGGMLLAPAIILFVMPVLIEIFGRDKNEHSSHN
jgi:cobalt-zinc-cadmium resistance protein CzcA